MSDARKEWDPEAYDSAAMAEGPRRPEAFVAEPARPRSVEMGNCPDDSCRSGLVDWMAEHGLEVTASTVKPLIPMPNHEAPMRCRHGVAWYMTTNVDPTTAHGENQ